MANRADAPFGFEPCGPLLHAGYYPITTAGANVFKHDLMSIDSSGDVARSGAAGNAHVILGSVIALFDSNGLPTTYLAAAASGFALIADDPMQEFVAQEDTTGDPLELADRGSNCDFCDDTAGDTDTGLSGMEIDSSEHNTTATTDLRIVRQYDSDNDTISATAATSYVRWVVKINAHANGTGTGGI